MAPLANFGEFFETDYSRFDLSISLPYLRQVEYLFLCLPFTSDDHWLFRVAMRLAQSTMGVSDIGLSYKVEGTRCSGDAHTSIGNGLINHFNTWLCLRGLPDGTWFSLHEGDDGVIGVAGSYADQVAYNLHLLPVLGFQAKIDRFMYLGQVSFCGRFLSLDGSGLFSVCDINRTLAKIHTTCSEGDPQSLMLAKAISYYHTDAGTPFIGAFSWAVINVLLPVVSRRRLTRAVRSLRSDWWTARKLERINFSDVDYPYVEPTPSARALVAIRCNYSPAVQVKFEDYYCSFVRLGFLPAKIHRIPHGWNVDPLSQIYGRVDDYLL